jgi:hypothetical protein
MKRLRGLDKLHGIAVCMVPVFHYTSGFEAVVRPHAPGLLFGCGVNLSSSLAVT